MLKSASAVAEFAIWLNLDLHANHLDLQYEDRLRSQLPLPQWAVAVGRNDATPFCAALLRGCHIDAARASAIAHGGADRGGSPSSPLLRHGQACARCAPRVDEASSVAAERARPMSQWLRGGASVTSSAAAVSRGGGSDGTKCAQIRATGGLGGAGAAVQRLRGLTQAECIAYARRRRLDFLGAQKEPNEFAGCVVWNGRTAEFNEHPRGTGCNVGSKGGECLCTLSA